MNDSRRAFILKGIRLHNPKVMNEWKATKNCILNKSGLVWSAELSKKRYNYFNPSDMELIVINILQAKYKIG